MLNEPSQKLCGSMTLAILEGSGDVVQGFIFALVMLAGSQDFSELVDFFLGISPVLRDFDAELVERKILTRRQAASKGDETGRLQKSGSILQGIALPGCSLGRQTI
jgi:hypothetical protein